MYHLTLPQSQVLLPSSSAQLCLFRKGKEQPWWQAGRRAGRQANPPAPGSSGYRWFGARAALAGSASSANGCRRRAPLARSYKAWLQPSPDQAQGSSSMPAPTPPLGLPARHVLRFYLIQPGSRQTFSARAPGLGLSEVKDVAPSEQRPESGKKLNWSWGHRSIPNEVRVMWAKT